VTAELDSEIEATMAEVEVWDWAAVPELDLPVAAAWAGWEIGSMIWEVFFPEDVPEGEGLKATADSWRVVLPGECVLSDQTGCAMSPDQWGLQGSSSVIPFGFITDNEACEFVLSGGAARRLYAPGWRAGSGCGTKLFRVYTIWKPFMPIPCAGGPACAASEDAVPAGMGGQPVAPTATELPEDLEEVLEAEGDPVYNEFLNHEFEPENFPDPRVTKKKVDEEERRCDRGVSLFENPGGNGSPEPAVKKEEEPFFVASPPPEFGSAPVYLRWGTTHWIPGTERFQEEEKEAYIDLWGGWGYRHIAAKHGWNTLDRFETELALARPQTPEPTQGGWEYTDTAGIAEGIEGVECERHVVIDDRPIFGTETPRGIVTSYNSVLP
jgi:hypothetical protein